MQLPFRKKEEDRLALSQQDFHVTPAKLESMKRTLEQLKKDRPLLVTELTTAREMGDLSENAAYTIAKSNLRKLDARVLSLEERIKNAIIIRTTGAEMVQLGSKVSIDGSRGVSVYEIVGPAETDPAQGRISFQSPIGVALLNKRKGDQVEVNGNIVGSISSIE